MYWKVWPVAILVGLLLGSALFPVAPAKASASEFDPQRAYQHVQVLAEQIGPRPAASDREQQAGEYIRKKFLEYGWQVQIQEFSRVQAIDQQSLKKFSLVNSRNIIAVRPGKSTDTIVIGAHIDSADFAVPGANDNASGVGVLLELARVLAEKPQQYTYVLVGFGAEELGLLGSRYFVDNYELSNVKFMIGLDMVGGSRTIALDGGGKISTPAQVLNRAYKLAKQSGLTPIVQRDFMLLARTSKDGGTSDFSPFLDKWVPAIGLGQGGKAKPYYHQPSDTLDKVNPETLGAFGDFVLVLLAHAGEFQQKAPWSTDYLSVDTGLVLLILPPLAIKLLVIGVLGVALIWIIKQRSAQWWGLLWLIPAMLMLVFYILLAASLPEVVIGKIKRISEPWHVYPWAFLVLKAVFFAVILTWLAQYKKHLPKKLLPQEPNVYLAACILTLGAGTVFLAFNHWEVAGYLAVWLLLIPLCRFRYGFFAVLGGPVMLYSVQLSLLNSHLWSSLYASAQKHFLLTNLALAVVLLPLVLSLLGFLSARNLEIRLKAKVAVSILLMCTLGCLILPAYSEKVPQEIVIREEWREHKLTLQVKAADTLPAEISAALKASKRTNQLNIPLQGGEEPVQFKTVTTEAKLKEERLITCTISGQFKQKPYLLKLKLSSDKPFTLVNSGDLFPLGKLNNKVKLTGESYQGVYGLVLERYAPVPQQVSLYLRAQGTVHLTVETQYPQQFVIQQFAPAKGVVKYENGAIFSKDI